MPKCEVERRIIGVYRTACGCSTATNCRWRALLSNLERQGRMMIWPSRMPTELGLHIATSRGHAGGLRPNKTEPSEAVCSIYLRWAVFRPPSGSVPIKPLESIAWELSSNNEQGTPAGRWQKRTVTPFQRIRELAVAGKPVEVEEACLIHGPVYRDGMPQAGIAKHLGRHKSWENHRLTLLERLCDSAPDSIHQGGDQPEASGYQGLTVLGDDAKLPERTSQPEAIETCSKDASA